MRSGLLTSLTALLAGTGMALAQAPRPSATTQTSQAVRTPAASASAPVLSASPAPAASAYPPAVTSGEYTTDASTGAAMGTVAGQPGGVLTGEDLAGDGPLPSNYHFYARPEYLLWKVPDGPLPPLQTMLPFTTSGIPSFTSNAGFAGDDVEYGATSGGRLTAGYWVNDCLGFEGSFFQFSQKGQTFTAQTVSDLPLDFTPSPTVVLDPVLGVIILQPPTITQPFELTTNIVGTGRITDFWGAEANVRCKKCYVGPFSWDFVGGFRTVRFGEDLSLNEDINLTVADAIVVPPGAPPPLPGGPPATADLARIATMDRVSTRNQFYGAQVGVSGEWWICPRVLVTGFAKLAVGGMYEQVTIIGSTTTQAFIPNLSPAGAMVGPSTPTTPVTTAGGLLTPGVGLLRADFGRVAWVPEVNATIGYLVTDHIRAYVGYDLLYISNLARPGEQISFSQTSSSITLAGQPQTITVIEPGFRFHSTDLKLQGLVAGLEFRF